MTHNERVKVGELWLGIALIYGKEINSASLGFMLDAVDHLPFNAVSDALKGWPRHSKHQRHPFPAEIIELASGGVSSDSEATAAASRIFQAVSRYGYPNGRDAKDFIGSLGWQVVTRLGGWTRVCEMVGVDYDQAAFIAHAKAIARAEAEFARAGRSNEAPQLPESTKYKNQGLVSSRDIVQKLLPSRK